MGLLSRLKAKYRHTIEKKYVKSITRRQFNLTISEDIIFGVKFLAAILHVPRYVITEHLLQVGSYHILSAIKDEDERRKLEEHLVKVHLLGNELKNEEALITSNTN